MDLIQLTQILGAIRQLRGHGRWSRRQLEDHQSEALGQLRRFAYERSPFYRRFHQGLFDRPLHELPVLNKATLMDYFDELVTDRSVTLEAVRDFTRQPSHPALFLGRYRVVATSGSSGHPGLFLFSRPEWTTIVASFARGQEWSGSRVSLLRRQSMATVASISPWHTSSQVADTARSWWTPSFRLPASDPLPSIVSWLNDLRPDALVAYASMAGVLAEEQLAGRLKIHPSRIYTSSEVLTDKARRRIEQAWGSAPFNQYGATETANIAAEHAACRHLHLFEDLVIAEAVDEHNKPVPAGVLGAKLLVTTLFSRTQPLIRYELEDSVRLSGEACPIGLPFAYLTDIQGRVEDSLSLPAPEGGRLVVDPVVFSQVMDIAPVGGWQITQAADNSLTVLLSGAAGELADTDLIVSLTKALQVQGVKAPVVTVKHVSAIPKSASGKMPLIKAYRP